MEANLCVDTKFKGGNQRFGLDSCTKDNPGLGGEQVSKFTDDASFNQIFEDSKSISFLGLLDMKATLR